MQNSIKNNRLFQNIKNLPNGRFFYAVTFGLLRNLTLSTHSNMELRLPANYSDLTLRHLQVLETTDDPIKRVQAVCAVAGRVNELLLTEMKFRQLTSAIETTETRLRAIVG